MENDKHIDENWKDDVSRQKDEGCGCGSDSCAESSGCGDESCGSGEGCGCGCGDSHEQGEMQVNFLNYIMSMAYQAMIFLGEVPNPMTGGSERNLRQAKFLIDTLALIKDKTKGNLTPQEDNMLQSSLYELQMKFVELSQKES